MQNIERNFKKDLNNVDDIPSFEQKKYFYNCPECQSEIEIVKLQEQTIEFKCNNNHNFKMYIKKFLDKIKEYKDKNILNNNIISNNSKCNKHKEDYLSYCFECKMHLCNKCLVTGEHAYHYKINIIEVMPTNEKLN